MVVYIFQNCSSSQIIKVKIWKIIKIIKISIILSKTKNREKTKKIVVFSVHEADPLSF